MELTLQDFKQRLNLARQEGVTIPYIRGPQPKNWVSRACKLPARCANLAWALWYRHGMEGNPVRVTTRLRQDFGLTRQSTYRALELMEDTGLIKVERRKGCAPRVTMLDGQE